MQTTNLLDENLLNVELKQLLLKEQFNLRTKYFRYCKVKT